MPQARPTQRWEHATYRYAYVREYRGMACTVIHGSHPISTGYIWKPSSRAMAMRVLQERLDTYLGIRIAPAREAPRLTCGVLIDRWAEVRSMRMGTAYIEERAGIARRIVPVDTDATDAHGIRAHVLALPYVAGLNPNTRAQYLGIVRSVFDWGISEGLCTINPVTKDMAARPPAKGAMPHTAAEIEAIIAAIAPEHRRYYRLLATSGMREIEAVQLRWEDVYDTHVVVRGKRSNGREMWRDIPYALMPGLREVLTPRESKGRVFPFSYSSYLRLYHNAVTATGVRRLKLHAFRQYVATELSKRGLPEQVQTAIMGHTTAVGKAHYREQLGWSDLVRMGGGDG